MLVFVRGYFFPEPLKITSEEFCSSFFSESSLLTHSLRAKPRLHTRPSLTPTSSFLLSILFDVKHSYPAKRITMRFRFIATIQINKCFSF